MKKKIIMLIIFIVTMTSIISCRENTADAKDEEMFVVVQESWEYDIVYDKETKVMYTYSKGGYGYRTDYDNRGVFTLLVDENGNPKLWDGE